jgi:RNA polymerase sigma-70 factor (ECF subfamily)
VTSAEERQSADLMRQSQTGDQEAYATLLVLLTSVTRKYARARAGSVAWIDDVVQETLITVDRARHTYDPSRPFAPWFYAIASSRLIDAVRRDRRTSMREVVPETPFDVPTSEHVHDDIDVQAIHEALRTLPPQQRDIIEGLKFRDESVRDLATRMNMTAGAVRVTAHRGYRKLKALLGRNRED